MLTGKAAQPPCLTTTSDDTWNGIIESRKIFISTYTQPVPRFPPPPCTVIAMP